MSATTDPSGEYLARLLRRRPATLDGALALAPDDLDGAAALRELADAGFLSVDGDELRFAAPEQVLADAAGHLLRRERDALDAAIRLVDRLPGLARSWELGQVPGGQAIQGEVVHGKAEAIRHWFEVTARLPQVAPCGVGPDLAWVHEDILPLLDEVGAEFAAGDVRIRYLFPPDAVEDDRDRAAVDALIGIGAEVRLRRDLPSWFHVDRGVMVALPLDWGALAPVGMTMIYTPAIIDAVADLFDALWAGAAPYPAVESGWQPVLELMDEGRTDEQIAAHLRLGVRTVRRRIAEAMEEFDVTTRFELGAAWAARGRR